MPSTPPIKVPILGEDKYSKEFMKMTRSAEKMGQKVGALGKKMTMALTLPIVGIGVASLSMSKTLNESMANVGTLIPGQTEKLKGLRKEVIQLGIDTGTAFGVITEGLYETISAFPDEDNPMKKLTIAAKAAKAGVSTTKDALSLISLVTKKYGDTTDAAAQKVSDLAFTTVNLGQTSFPELATSMGDMVTIASNLNVPMEELFASMAALTTGPGSASKVGTQVVSLMTAFIKPTEAMSKAAEDLEFSSAAAMISELGLAGAVKALGEITGGSTDKLGALVSRKEGMVAAMDLMGKKSESFTSLLVDMSKVSGATDTAFKQQTKGMNEVGFAYDQGVLKVKAFMLQIGDKLMPVVGKLIDKLQPLMDSMAGVSGETLEMGIKIAAGVAVIGPLLMVIGKTVSMVAALSGSIAGAGGLAAVMAAITGPIGVVVAAVAAVAAAFAFMLVESKSLRDAIAGPFISVFEDLKAGFNTIFSGGSELGGMLRSLAGFIGDMIAPVVNLSIKFTAWPIKYLSVAFRVLAPVIKVVFSAIKLLAKALQFGWNWMGNLVDKFLEGTEAGRGLATAFGHVSDAVGTAWEYIKGLWDTVKGFFSGVSEWLDMLGVKLDKASGKKQKAMGGGFGAPGGDMSGGGDPKSYIDENLIYRIEENKSRDQNFTFNFKGLPDGVSVTASSGGGGKVKAKNGGGGILDGAF